VNNSLELKNRCFHRKVSKSGFDLPSLSNGAAGAAAAVAAGHEHEGDEEEEEDASLPRISGASSTASSRGTRDSGIGGNATDLLLAGLYLKFFNDSFKIIVIIVDFKCECVKIYFSKLNFYANI